MDRVLADHAAGDLPGDPLGRRCSRSALSIDDFIITSFVAGQTLTFPLWVYGSVKVGIPPQVFAMGTLIFAVGVLIAIAGLLVGRRSPKNA